MYKNRLPTILFLFLLTASSVIGQPSVGASSDIGPVSNLPNHPRILLLKGEEESIKRTIATDPAWKNLHTAILTECDVMLATAPVERIQIGRRLLDKSREALRRLFFLSYAWRMTRDPKYLQRGERELLAVAAFSDWNPSHFLDVAEMTMGVAIGYDWLYDGLSETTRTAVQRAILTKGIEPSLDAKNNGWLQNTNNWNQVCNAGMAYGAMAIYETNPALAVRILNRAVTTVVLPMGEYRPDGAYPEGYGYWGYGTSFNVMLISAIEKLYGRDFGLTGQPGFLKTAGYLENMTGPSGDAFNYGDSGLSGSLQPAMFWFAARAKNPSLLWRERQYLLNPAETKRQVKDRLLPAAMLWSDGVRPAAITEPRNLIWVGQGKNPVALMRSSWSDSAAIYVGLKGGSPGLSHGHMDVGSFVMEADGVRWALDFGMQNYESLESKGVDLWNMRQDSPRWRVFRYNNRAHNTLTVNDGLQRVDGKARLTRSSANPQFMNATTDLTELYSESLTRASRGVAILGKQYVAVRDELETGTAETTVRWTMLTGATVKLLGNNRAELTKEGKTLLLQVQEPAIISVKTWSTTPPNSYDAPNSGTVFVGFEVRLPANTKTALTVLLIPQKSSVQAKPPVLSLQQWPH